MTLWKMLLAEDEDEESGRPQLAAPQSQVLVDEPGDKECIETNQFLGRVLATPIHVQQTTTSRDKMFQKYVDSMFNNVAEHAMFDATMFPA